MNKPLAAYELKNSKLRSIDQVARQLFLAAGYKGHPFYVVTGYDDDKFPEYNSCYILLLEDKVPEEFDEEDAKQFTDETIFMLLYHGDPELNAKPSKVMVLIFDPLSKITKKTVDYSLRLLKGIDA